MEPAHVAYRLYVDDVAGVGRQILARAGVELGPVKAALQELINGLEVVQAAKTANVSPLCRVCLHSNDYESKIIDHSQNAGRTSSYCV